MQLALRRKGMGAAAAGFCPTYPPSITFEQSLQCAFAPWTDTCVLLKRQAQDECRATALSPPPPPIAPAIDTNPASPTYGQATVDGVVVSSPQQAQALIDEQIAQQSTAWKAQNQVELTQAAVEACEAMKSNCGPFTSPNAACTACEFDPATPAFLITAFAVVGILFAFRK